MRKAKRNGRRAVVVVRKMRTLRLEETYKTSAQYTNKRNCSRKTWKAEVGSEVVHAGEMCMSTL